MDTNDKMEELLKLIQDIADNGFDESESKQSQWKLELISIYSDVEFRHSYAELSKQMENIDPQQRDYVRSILDNILITSDAEGTGQTIIKKIAKLCDHIELENIRLNRMSHIEYIGDKVPKQQQESSDALKENERNIQSMTRKVNSFNSQIITVLGIFAGMVITFAVISQITTSFMSHIKRDNIYPLLLGFVTVGFVLYNTIFMMLYIISRIANVNISVLCRGKNCDTCLKRHKSVMRIIRKYPYIFWVDIVLLVIITILLFIILSR